MNYENAADILPEDLLERVQKFAAGKLIYVPETIGKRSWGETSGYKRYLAERNQEIKDRFISGSTIENLADEYNLSVESIKKLFTPKAKTKNRHTSVLYRPQKNLPKLANLKIGFICFYFLMVTIKHFRMV